MTRPSEPRSWNPLFYVLVGLIRFYQKVVSPALPRSCKYYPSCSQYAVDALREYGVVRGVILAGWRLLRCNPVSYGGYDPVEHQKLFKKKTATKAVSRKTMPVSEASLGRRSPRTILLIALLAVFLLGMPVFAASCSFLGFGEATTTTIESTGTDGTTATTIEEGKDAGFLAGTLKPLQALFFWVLEFFHDRMGVSWSWAIVILTIIVRIVLIPLTWRQLKSMRAMQVLQPQIKELQEKYKNDRQLQQQKLMEFYQENKVSPFSSCLPLVLQLPVFFGLYYTLRTAGMAGLDPEVAGRWAGVFAQGAADYPVGWLWIHDITQFDYVLMFLYIASQFVASWQTARKAGGQQKMIAYFMPIIVGIFMFIGKWPSGLFIYWFTSNLWTIAQQFVAEKFMPAPVPAVATPAKGGGAKRTPAKAVTTKSGKPAAAKTATSKAKSTKAGASQAKSTKAKPTKAAPQKDEPTDSASADQSPSGGSSGKPAGKSGGKPSGQKQGKQRKAKGSQGQRSNRGTGRPKGTR